jgi:ATP-binding cassette subfamily B protein
MPATLRYTLLMTLTLQNSTSNELVLPDRWATEITPMLATGETTQAWLEIDLDHRLKFASGMVLLTNRRLLARSPDDTGWQEWPLQAGLKLQHHDHAGVGSLELVNGQGKLATWRYTLARNLAALRVISEFELHRDSAVSGQPVVRSTEDCCPKCKVPLPPGEDECPICNRENAASPSTWTLFRLWRFARPYRWQLLTGFLLTLASTGATLVPPYLTMPLMDEVLIPFQNGKPIDWPLVTMYLGGLLGAAVLAWGLGWIRTYILSLVSERIGRDLRTTTYEHLLGLSLEYFGGKRTGDLMARIGNETDRINIFLSLDLLNFATDVLMITMTAVILFTINPWLALVTLLPLPIIAWMIHFVREKLRTGFEKIDRVWAEVTNVLADTIPGIRVVKAFAQEKREGERFRAANEHNLQMNDKLNKTWSLFTPTVTLLTEVGLLVVWIFGIWQISKGIEHGRRADRLPRLHRPLLHPTRLDEPHRLGHPARRVVTKRIFDILDHVSSVPEPSNPVHLSGVTGRLELKKASFRYGTRAVTKDVDLVIQPGEMIGLVGHSGSGKSTLVNLICRFYDVSEGQVLIDGVDVRSVPVAEFRQHIGLVLQEPFLFFGTIADNIAYGKPNATRQEIIAAARAAHAHEFILRLPHGYDSLVGERGQGLSGGERQRISIARALLIDPRILILDEATSAVDTETEKEIQKALDNLVKGRTTIAIAHRLSTLRKADRLVVMDRGRSSKSATTTS